MCRGPSDDAAQQPTLGCDWRGHTACVLADQNIRRDLPLGEAVPVDITMPTSGQIALICGMGMLRGAVVVR